MRPLLVTLLVLAAAAPAAAQDAPQIEIGDPAAAAIAPIRMDGKRVGELVVERVGSRIVATAKLRRRPGRHVRLCVDVGGEQQCVRRAARRVTLRHEADFLAPLRAVARSGGARGAVAL